MFQTVQMREARGRAPVFPDRWGQAIINRLPPEMARQAHDRWVAVANSGIRYPGIRHDGLAPHAKANGELARLRNELAQLKFSVAVSAAEIADAALKLADLCERRAFSGVKIAEHFGIEVKWPKNATEDSIRRRFCDARWWRKQLHTVIGRAIEEMHRRRGLVRAGKAVYLTDWSLRRWRGRRAANSRMLEDSVAVNEEGATLELWDVVQKSVSNPELRRKEMMLRARGFEQQARDNGYTWTFATLTCPSAFHPQMKKGGDNSRYQGGTVRDGQAWLCGRWEGVRASLHREGVMIFGFRVAEPNHDGTPHWHALLFVRPDKVDRLEELLRNAWLAEYADEPGAAEHRVSFARENAARPGSSAAGYIAKYIGKNIDGHGVDVDHESSLEGADGAERATAWASVHGVRQFQQIGGPAVALWRECRRLRDPIAPPEIEAARVHTSKPACWAKFIDAIGGIVAGRKTAIQPWKKLPLDLNRYGEKRAPAIIGIRSIAHRIRTRVHVWRIERKPKAGEAWFLNSGAATAACSRSSSSLGPVSITVRARQHPAALNSEGFTCKTGPCERKAVQAVRLHQPDP